MTWSNMFFKTTKQEANQEINKKKQKTKNESKMRLKQGRLRTFEKETKTHKERSKISKRHLERQKIIFVWKEIETRKGERENIKEGKRRLEKKKKKKKKKKKNKKNKDKKPKRRIVKKGVLGEKRGKLWNYSGLVGSLPNQTNKSRNKRNTKQIEIKTRSKLWAR